MSALGDPLHLRPAADSVEAPKRAREEKYRLELKAACESGTHVWYWKGRKPQWCRHCGKPYELYLTELEP